MQIMSKRCLRCTSWLKRYLTTAAKNWKSIELIWSQNVCAPRAFNLFNQKPMRKIKIYSLWIRIVVTYFIFHYNVMSLWQLHDVGIIFFSKFNKINNTFSKYHCLSEWHTHIIYGHFEHVMVARLHVVEIAIF
jgi:hypothetical protein